MAATTRSFAAFGVALEVDERIEIPGLGHGAAPAAVDPPTRIVLDAPELTRRWSARGTRATRTRELREGEQVVLTVDVAEPGYLLHVDGIARMLIAPDGTEILCAPEPNPRWAGILPAQALPLAATLRGLEVLHAAGVALEAGAILLAGPPGAGKSSLTRAFLRRGATLLSDDAVALQPRGEELLAHPGVGLLYLRPAEDGRLAEEDRAALPDPIPFAGKQRYALPVSGPPVPLRALFLLERSSRELDPIEHVGSAAEPMELLATTFNLSVRTPERLIRHLDLVTALAASERIYRLRVRPDIDATRLAAIAEDHLSGARL